MKSSTEVARGPRGEGTEAAGAVGLRIPGAGEVQKSRRRWWPVIPCIVLYVVLAVLEFGPSNTLGPGHMAGPGSADQIIDVWWIAWAHFAVAHGHNPFFTDWQNYPVGLNGVVNTSMLALGWLIGPITGAFGPIVAWNVLERLALILSATAMCVALRRWTDWWPAAFVGGLLYGFSALETTSVPHLNVAFVPLPPLFFLLLYEVLVRQRWRPSRAGALLGVICAVQYLISSEILASMVLFGAVATVLFLVANRRALSSMAGYAKRAGAFALAVGGALLAGPVLFTLLGPQHVNGVPNSPANLALLHGDLLATFVPGYAQRFALHGLLAGYQINAAVMYVGIPFVVAVGLVTVLLRSRGVVVMAGTLAGIAFVLSLGSTLYVAGRDTHVPLPFAVLAHLPVVEGLLSTRLALYTVLFGSAVVAIGLDALRHRMARSDSVRRLSAPVRAVTVAGATLVLAAIVAVPMVPANAQPATTSRTSPFFTSSSATRGIAPGSTVLAYPYPDAPVFPGNPYGFSFSPRYQALDDALLDQAVAGMAFKLIGSYGWRPAQGGANAIGPSDLRPSSVKDLFDYAFYGVTTRPDQAAHLETDHLVRDIRSFLRRYDVSTVVVLPVGQRRSAVTGALAAAVGAPAHLGGVDVWFDVPHRLRAVAPAPAFRLQVGLPVTTMAQPASGAHVGAHEYLVARASSPLGVRSVSFELSGVGAPATEICRGVPFRYGWVCAWNTAGVARGTYTVRSVVTDDGGHRARSPGVVVHVGL